jgi:hypothetical protein
MIAMNTLCFSIENPIIENVLRRYSIQSFAVASSAGSSARTSILPVFAPCITAKSGNFRII